MSPEVITSTITPTTIGVVTNPNAGKNKRNPHLLDELQRILGDRGIVRETTSPEELPAVVDEFNEAGVDLLCINGGDGTQHVTLSAFRKHYDGTPLPTYFGLRGGTMNTVAHSNKIKGTPAKQLESVLTHVVEKKPIPTFKQKTLRLNDDIGFIFGTGGITNVLEQYYDGKRRGAGKAAYVLGRAIATLPFGAPHLRKILKPVHADVTVDGEKLDVSEFSFIFASTVVQVGIGLKIAYRANESKAKFHFVAGNLSPLQLFGYLPRLMKGTALNDPLVMDELVTGLNLVPVQTDDNNQVYYTFDGELYPWDEPLRVTLGPTLDAVRL